MVYTTSLDGRFLWDSGTNFGGEYYVTVIYRGITIFAVSEEQIDYLEAFVKAEYRIATAVFTKSTFAQLPYIFHSPKYKKDMLRKLSKLRLLLKNEYCK